MCWELHYSYKTSLLNVKTKRIFDLTLVKLYTLKKKVIGLTKYLILCQINFLIRQNFCYLYSISYENKHTKTKDNKNFVLIKKFI